MSQIRITRRTEILNKTGPTKFTEAEVFSGDRFYEVTDDPNPPFEKEYVENQIDIVAYFLKGDPWAKRGDRAEITLMGETQTGIVYKVIDYQSQSGYTPQNRAYECHFILDK